MKRTFHLLGQAVPLVLLWAAIVEIGFRMQQYSPLGAPWSPALRAPRRREAFRLRPLGPRPARANLQNPFCDPWNNLLLKVSGPVPTHGCTNFGADHLPGFVRCTPQRECAVTRSKWPQPGQAEAALGASYGLPGAGPARSNNDQSQRIVPRQPGDNIPFASGGSGVFYLHLSPVPDAIPDGAFRGGVGWSIAASNTPLSKVSNAAHGNGRSNWTKGPLNPAPPKRELLQ